MSDFRLYQMEMLHLLWGIPLLALLFWYARRKRKAALAAFADSKLIEKLDLRLSGGRRVWKELLVLLAAGSIIVSLARPAWNRIPQEVTRRGRDVVFVIDVSRSMLAEDLRPNRLERAKLAVLDGVSKLGGDRVGLVVFAGAASVKCPLTLDYGFFRMALEDISPESVPVGGTLIGDAVRKALSDVFDNKASQYRDLVLITDGEDHDSFPVEAAREAGKRKIRILAIGLGDENVGRRIPITDERGQKTFLKYKGQEVWSRLDADALRAMAAETPGGRYLNVATGAIDFGDVYQQLIATAERRDLESETLERFEEKFQIFLGLGFLLLLGEAILSEKKR
jgi:Ca-activated chloride channel homolog